MGVTPNGHRARWTAIQARRFEADVENLRQAYLAAHPEDPIAKLANAVVAAHRGGTADIDEPLRALRRTLEESDAFTRKQQAAWDAHAADRAAGERAYQRAMQKRAQELGQDPIAASVPWARPERPVIG